jgi:hypothetical protein
MKDNVLKKQFKKHDVERMRNLIKGKHGERTTVGVGYTGETQPEYKEGDIWEQDGKTWTIKNGIKENITKLDKFKQVSVPLFCPNCNQIMDKQLDSHYYKAYGTCLDCRVTFETDLKKKGLWEDYIKDIYNKEIENHKQEYLSFMEDALNESNNNYISENGEVQKWVGGIDKKRATESIEEAIKYFDSLKKS